VTPTHLCPLGNWLQKTNRLGYVFVKLGGLVPRNFDVVLFLFFCMYDHIKYSYDFIMYYSDCIYINGVAQHLKRIRSKMNEDEIENELTNGARLLF
jgi:hypothetical protein